MIALGDITEQCLRFFGITKDRVQAVTGAQDCGCAKRQAAMNELGYRWQGWAAQRVHAIRYSKAVMRIRLAATYLRMAWRVLVFGR